MNVAILTQPLATNYGGILQAWALQQVLIRMGHVPTTVDRQYDRRSSIAQAPGGAKRLLQDAALLPFGKTLYHQNLKYVRAKQADFITRNIRMSPRLASESALRRYFCSNEYDAIIVGSDQVWRPRYSPRLETFFLDFVKPSEPTKCLAYAASFGVDAWEYTPQQTTACGMLARKFDGISVREASAVDMCLQHLGVDAQHVLDPTLLLNKADYVTSFCAHAEAGKEDLYAYVLDQNAFKTQVMSKVSRQLKLPISTCQPRRPQSIIRRDHLSAYQYPAADAWVRGFRNAEFVVTDSFHGTVFALIFEKPFIAIGNPERGIARFKSLLQLVGMEDRLIYSDRDMPYEHLIGPIDFSDAKRRLDAVRAQSFDFLKVHL